MDLLKAATIYARAAYRTHPEYEDAIVVTPQTTVKDVLDFLANAEDQGKKPMVLYRNIEINVEVYDDSNALELETDNQGRLSYTETEDGKAAVFGLSFVAWNQDGKIVWSGRDTSTLNSKFLESIRTARYRIGQ